MFNKLQRFKPIFSRQTLLSSTHPKLKFDTLHPTLTIFTQTLTNLNSNPSNRDENVSQVQTILKLHNEDLEDTLDKRGLRLDDAFVTHVLKCHRSEWKTALRFFDWARKKDELSGYSSDGYSPGVEVCNEMLDILGRMKRFTELRQVFDEMAQREGMLNQRTFAVLMNRYAAGHKVEEAIEVFNKRKQLGFGVGVGFDTDFDLFAYQMLLISLCRYKHVEDAESFFLSKRDEFPPDIKTLNIVLNGWCVRGNVHEAKRFWKDIMSSHCKPDKFTYGIFINALTKSGKLGTALKLYRSMWDHKCTPDVAICSCVVDALCFKKRVPEALQVFEEMKERGVPPSASTYNSLIKHLCKIARMEKVYELVEEMEEKNGDCAPDVTTFNYLLKSAKKPDEVVLLRERMRRNGVETTGDTYNVLLKLFLDWNDEVQVQSVWEEMQETGLGPGQPAYTIMVHALHKKGKYEEALKYFGEMSAKGMIPEPRTDLLVAEMETKMKEAEKIKEAKNGQGEHKTTEGKLLEIFLKNNKNNSSM